MVFQHPPKGVRKIIISTNIAETSVTIDDIKFVVDIGKLKENRYDPVNQMPALVEAWEAKANARQRKGRAGRVAAGRAFYLFSKATHAAMDDFQSPEILRVPLSELCLQVTTIKGG